MTTTRRGRSSSRGRGPKAAKAAPQKPLPDMEFAEGDQVMAKWPGTNLFYPAKVSFVRNEDNEYDVQFADGTVFTLAARVVKKSIPATAGKKPRSRSRSRGRSPGRQESQKKDKTKSPKGKKTATKMTTTTTSPRKASSSRSRAAKSVKAAVDTTPVRSSARIRKVLGSELSDGSEDEQRNHVKNKYGNSTSQPAPSSSFDVSGWCNWLLGVSSMLFWPTALIWLHIMCGSGSCVPHWSWNKLPKTLNDYWNWQAMACVAGFVLTVRLLSLLPIGSVVRTPLGHPVRMNGLYSLLLLMAAVPAMIYAKLDMSFVSHNYFYLMTSSMIMSVFLSLVAFLMPDSSKSSESQVVQHLLYGRHRHPMWAGTDWKLLLNRVSMIGLVCLNVLLVVSSIQKTGTFNASALLASCCQVIYVLDAMIFEKQVLLSYNFQHNGFGFAFIGSCLCFPFVPTLITKYLLYQNPTLSWPHLSSVILLQLLSYVMFRMAENVRCQFAATDPLRHLKVPGLWRVIRYPNHLADILIHWAWILPAVTAAGQKDWLLYSLPVCATLMLVLRCRRLNCIQAEKFGLAWKHYCEQVRANLIPKLY